MFTAVPFMYRDNSNNKDYGTLVLIGELSPELREEIRSCLANQDMAWFVPQQVGIDPVGTPNPNYDDQWWHELHLDEAQVRATRPSAVHEPVCEGGTVAEFRDRMVAASAQGWDASVEEDE